MSNTQTANDGRMKITADDFNAISGALARLEELRNTKSTGAILTRDRQADAEKIKLETEGLVEFLAAELIKHGGELLGCWLIIKNEYEPLCVAMQNTFSRIAVMCAQRDKNRATQAKAAKEQADKLGQSEPANVVKLEQ